MSSGRNVIQNGETRSVNSEEEAESESGTLLASGRPLSLYNINDIRNSEASLDRLPRTVYGQRRNAGLLQLETQNSQYQGGGDLENRLNTRKKEKETKTVTLKDFMHEKPKIESKNFETVKAAMCAWMSFTKRSLLLVFWSISALISCRSEALTMYLKKYMVLLIYKKSDILDKAKVERDKERTFLDTLIPYSIPLASYSRARRLLHHGFYIPNVFIIFKLLTNQFNSKKLVFQRINFLFYITLVLYFLLRSVEPKALIKQVVQVLSSVYVSSDPVKFCVYFLLLALLEVAINLPTLLQLSRIPIKNHSSEYIFLFMVMYYHFYFQSLDIFKLEKDFLSRHIHLSFSPTSFLYYSYTYLFLSLCIPYFLISLIFRCYYILIPFCTVISIIVSLSTYITNVINYTFLSILLFVCLKYRTEVDKFFNVPFFARTEEINVVLLSYRVCMGCYEGNFRIASFVRIIGLIFLFHVHTVYNISKYNNR